MSTWISDPGRVAPVLLLLLAGCLGQIVPQPGAADEAATFGLPGGEVTLAAPLGFCVDPVATRQDGDTAFALFASCAVLTGAAPYAPESAPGLLTASLGDAGSAVGDDTAALAGFLRSPEGRRMLSRRGRPDSIGIRAEDRSETLLLMLISDESPALAPALGSGYWRAWFDVGSRLASVAVYAPGDSPAELARARALLERFVARMRDANAEDAGNRAARVLPPGGHGVLLV